MNSTSETILRMGSPPAKTNDLECGLPGAPDSGTSRLAVGARRSGLGARGRHDERRRAGGHGRTPAPPSDTLNKRAKCASRVRSRDAAQEVLAQRALSAFESPGRARASHSSRSSCPPGRVASSVPRRTTPASRRSDTGREPGHGGRRARGRRGPQGDATGPRVGAPSEAQQPLGRQADPAHDLAPDPRQRTEAPGPPRLGLHPRAPGHLAEILE